MKKSATERSAIARKAVATRKRNQEAAKRSAVAHKAVATRKRSEAGKSEGELGARRRAAALKAWQTRRARAKV